jgi:hypothetical protein
MLALQEQRERKRDKRPYASRLLSEKTDRTQSDGEFGKYMVNFGAELERVREIKDRLKKQLERSNKVADKHKNSTLQRIEETYPDPSNLAQSKANMNLIVQKKTPLEIFYAIKNASMMLKHENCVAQKDVFTLFDTDGGGTISLSEFRRALLRLGIRVLLQDSKLAFETYDIDNSGTLDVNEFRFMLTNARRMSKDADYTAEHRRATVMARRKQAPPSATESKKSSKKTTKRKVKRRRAKKCAASEAETPLSFVRPPIHERSPLTVARMHCLQNWVADQEEMKKEVYQERETQQNRRPASAPTAHWEASASTSTTSMGTCSLAERLERAKIEASRYQQMQNSAREAPQGGAQGPTEAELTKRALQQRLWLEQQQRQQRMIFGTERWEKMQRQKSGTGQKRRPASASSRGRKMHQRPASAPSQIYRQRQRQQQEQQQRQQQQLLVTTPLDVRRPCEPKQHFDKHVFRISDARVAKDIGGHISSRPGSAASDRPASAAIRPSSAARYRALEEVVEVGVGELGSELNEWEEESSRNEWGEESSRNEWEEESSRNEWEEESSRRKSRESCPTGRESQILVRGGGVERSKC